MLNVEINPRVCNGKPVIIGTRIPVTVILDQIADGCSLDDVQHKYPELSRPLIVDALRYCHAMIEHCEIEIAIA